MKFLVTGGAGYIGSHAAHLLVDSGHEVVVLDNFCSGHRWAVPEKAELEEGDVGDGASLEKVFGQHSFDGVLHFAGFTEVAESVSEPLKFYQNNTIGALTLSEACMKNKVGRLVFCSTADVYGEPSSNELLREDMPLSPLNTYGKSMFMIEKILEDLSAASGGAFKYVILRSFNVAGALSDLKVAAEAAVGKRSGMQVYGTDYPTPDGTYLRDFIHVEDLAQAHIDALMYLERGGVSDVFNVGYGKPQSVLQVIEAMKRVSGCDFKVTQSPRREGDLTALAADASKIKRVVGWKPRYADIDLICKTAYEWERVVQERGVKNGS